jgi:hypothetical protein
LFVVSKATFMLVDFETAFFQLQADDDVHCNFPIHPSIERQISPFRQVIHLLMMTHNG